MDIDNESSAAVESGGMGGGEDDGEGESPLEAIDIFHFLFLLDSAADASGEPVRDATHPVLEHIQRLDKQLTDYLRRISSSLEQFNFVTEER